MSTISERSALPTVLLVEDNLGDATMMKLSFRKARLPVCVIVAQTAEIALAMLRREPQYAHLPFPDIILLDLNLPTMRGCQFLSVVKADARLRIIPIVILSSSNAIPDVTAAYQDYANGFIVKPFSLDEYETVVNTIEDYWFDLVQTLPSHLPSRAMAAVV